MVPAEASFADVEAEVYVLVDGDATYHAQSAPEMVRRLLSERLDMVVGRRQGGLLERGGDIEPAHRPAPQPLLLGPCIG